MKITPLDIRHKEFKRGLRGYVDTEVDEFLDMVADEFERIFKEHMELGERVEALNEKITAYKRIEDALQKTLVSAQTSAEEVKQNASKSAQIIVNDAELKSRQIMNAAYGEKQTVEQAIAKLRSLEQEFRIKFQQMLQGYLRQSEESTLAVGEEHTGSSEAQADLARHADAIREAISREGAATPARSEAPPVTPASAAPARSEEASVSAPASPPTVAWQTGQSEAPAKAPSAGESGTAPSAPASPTAADARATERERVVLGDHDVLLADVDSSVGENEFKW